MRYDIDTVVKATATKSRPGQALGLGLEETNHCILVTEVAGLFEKNNVPIHTGDQLLEVNGIPVTDKEQFPNGLKDVRVFLKREWNIWVIVKKGRSFDDCDHTAPTVASEDSYSERHSTPQTVGSDSEQSSIEELEDEVKETMRVRTSKPRRKERSRSKSPFAALTAVEKKRKGRKPRSTRKKISNKSDYGSENTGTTQSMSTDDNTPSRSENRTCHTGTLLSIEEDDAVNVSPLMPPKSTQESSDATIKNIHDSQRITVELNDGKSVCVSPKDYLAAVSDHSRSWDPNGKLKIKLDELMKIHTPRGNAPYVPDLLSLKNLLEDASIRVSLSNLLASRTNNQDLEDSPHQPRSPSSTKNLINQLRACPTRKALPLLLSEPETQSPLMNIMEEHFTEKLTRSRSQSRSQSPQPENLSSHNSSTHSCMTNLIDPGDLMKIRGFKSRPKLNGATVEAVRKSKGMKGKRWDVRIISKKHIKKNSDVKRLISVSAENLKHFM
jgi:hypothetical protein